MTAGQGRDVAAFTIPERGHIQRMLPVAASLGEAGFTVHVFAHEGARPEIERTGARFVDLYADRPVAAADATSRPDPIRYVSFAGHFGDDVVRTVAPLRPCLVVHDTFAVIGRVVAHHLGVPRVNVRAGHNLRPDRHLAEIRLRVPVHVSARCEAALHALRTRHGIADASPFSYFIDDGADLNLYAEPPEFLPPDQRAPFEPVAFFGSYWPAGAARAPGGASPFGPGATAPVRLYVSFGTVVWQHAAPLAMAAMETIADALAGRPDVAVLISLGGHDPVGATARLGRANVRVERYVDQIRVLREATACITHHGLNSTHEAIVHTVPMISFPFFGDQPGLAAHCRELGLAVPLGEGHGPPLTVEAVRAALARITAGGDGLRARLAWARDRELEVIRRRPEVVARIAGLLD